MQQDTDDAQYLSLGTGHMRCLDIGEGPPVVFVHGNPSPSDEFLPAISTLSANHRCIAVDHIGFGGSDKPPAWD